MLFRSRTDSGKHANLKIYGKGRKQRVVPLWKATVSYISKYTENYPLGMDNALFLNNRESLFRAVLLDGLTMLELIGETKLWKRLKSIQKDFLDALRENRPLILADCISVKDLSQAIDAYITLISNQAG